MTGGALVDAAVIGGGPAGCAVAIGLARAGRAVVLAESDGYARPRVGESLVPEVQPLLRRLGAWEAFLATAPLASLGTHSAWGADGAVTTHSHLTSPYQHGWHVDRAAFDAALAARASEAGAEVVLGERVAHVERAGAAWLVTSRSGWRCRARVLVDATGRSARVATTLGATRHVFDQLVGVGGVGRGAGDVGRHVLVEAVPEGWWYSAPLPDGGVIVLLMTDVDVCARRRLTTRRAWSAAVGRAPHTRARAGPATFGDARLHPAHSVRHRRADSRPWLAVGDAALSVDPLSGSGVVRALRAAHAATAAIERALGGDADALDRLEAEGDDECRAYLHDRLGYYASGPRFDSPFWARRHAVADRLRSA